MTDLDTVDFFTDPSLVDDPYPYYELLRASCPVQRLPHHGVVAVTGHQEALEVYRDPSRFSSCNAVTGPFPRLPFQPAGDDIGEQIAEHRHKFPMGEYLVTQDPPLHADHRALLMRLFTPRRMRENEAFMWRLADAQLDEFLHSGRCEVLRDYARPFALMVIADLLGVPEADHRAFRQQLGGQLPDASTSKGAPVARDPLAFLQETFTSYVEERRREPRGDVLTQLAAVTYSDGTVPEVAVVVRTATFLFAAGQDTTARLIASALRFIADRPDVQRYLRSDHARIPNFVEEVLRVESVVKSDFRLARRSTSLGGVDIPAGTTVMILPGAANRDPRRFEQPDELRPDRENAREHLSFGRGIHSCPGASLSRIEATVSIRRLLDRTTDIRIAEDTHGPQGARRFTYDPTYVLRGLQALHLELDADDA